MSIRLLRQGRLRASPSSLHHVHLQVSSRRCLGSLPALKISEAVRAAVAAQQPVVALETTIYTHGFPSPENEVLAAELEELVRSNGALPATIGVLNGLPIIGMQPAEVTELLASSRQSPIKKVSRRDLAFVSAAKLNGGTTVAATMLLAHLAGIRVFATGGLGGVHRNGETTMDVSADLTELGRTPVAVISSGCKSFLDIGRTLEVLETLGVGVFTFRDGQPDPVAFPAFWTRNSGFASPNVVQDDFEAATIIFAQQQIAIQSGLLFGNPIPKETELPASMMQDVMAQATHDAKRLGHDGAANTPFVLSRIRELTQGATLTANRALVRANVIRGARIAVELAALSQARRFATERPSQGAGFISIPEPKAFPARAPVVQERLDVLVAGALAMDISCDYAPLDGAKLAPTWETSNPGQICESPGGVARNVALAAHYAHAKIKLCSAVGEDSAAVTLLRSLEQQGLSTSNIVQVPGANSARYISFNDVQKGLVMAMADMNIFEESLSDAIQQWRQHLREARPRWVALDANWSPANLREWLCMARETDSMVAYEPVSVEKSTRVFDPQCLAYLRRHSDSGPVVDLASPNEQELLAMACRVQSLQSNAWSTEMCKKLLRSTEKSAAPAIVDLGLPLLLACVRILPYIPNLVVTLGSRGVLLCQKIQTEDLHSVTVSSRQESRNSLTVRLSHSEKRSDARPSGAYFRLFSPPAQIPSSDIVSVNGVGDTFLGVLLAQLAHYNIGLDSLPELIDFAQRAAALTLRSTEAVSPVIQSLPPSSTNDQS